MTLPFRTIRLRKHADYGLVYSASRKYQSGLLSFFYREQPSATPGEPRAPRFGITVPKVLGSAPLRNRLKRRIRVVARVALPLLPAGVDVVLHPRPAAATVPFPALQAEVAAVFTTVASRIAAGAPNAPQPRQSRRGKQAAPKPTKAARR